VDRKELVQRLVLNSICDDYENVDQVILSEVAADGAKCGLTIERGEVVDALSALIEDGLAKAYVLSCWEPAKELQGMPDIDVPEEYFKTYLHITKKGMDFHQSDDTWWPFDDHGNLWPDWKLDAPRD
jgi:hypothetical protein